MRLKDLPQAVLDHSDLSNITDDQHHLRPSVISASNTTLIVPPLPGGPGEWDIAVPFDTSLVLFSFRSPWAVELSGAVAGVTGVATRSSLDASTASLGGQGNVISAAYNAIYTKAGAALNLSHKVFDAELNNSIALTDVAITATGPSNRVLRTYWTNYSAGNRTLSVYAEIGVL